ncbi:MAG: EndoU domain-containing protein, partial [Anaerovoracaceae bacterium]
QEILDQQKTVADATSTIAAATRTYSQNQQQQAELEKQRTEQTAVAELQAQGGDEWEQYQKSTNVAEKQEILKNNSERYKTASETAQDWGMGGDKSRAVNAVTMAVTGALGGQTDLQVAANILAPYAAQVIGGQFGHGEDKNTAAQMVSHAILGAALAYVNGGDPTAGGSAAVASEAAADYLTNQYKDNPAYQNENGEFIPNLLPEDVKTQIRDLTAAIGAVVGGTVGDSAFEAQLAGVVGQNAVENNYLSAKQIQQFDQEMGNCKARNNCDQVIEKYKELALNQDKELASVCSVNAVLCKEKYGFIINSRKAIREALDKNKNIPAFYESGLFSQQMAAEGFVYNTELARQFKSKYNISDEDAVRYAMIVSSIGVGRAIKSKNQSTSQSNMTNKVSEEKVALERIKNNEKGANLTNKQNDSIINQQASKRVGNVTAPIDFNGHVLKAEIKSNGTVVGGHSIANGNVRVDSIVRAPDKSGVYEARVSVADPNNAGRYISKSNNNGVSTMFPNSWSGDRVKVEVDTAYKNRISVPNKPNMWEGTTPSGVKVRGYLQPKTTVYPVWTP